MLTMLPVVPLAVAALVQSPDWLAVCSTQIHPALEVVFAQDAAQSQPAAPPLFRTFTGDVPLPTELLNELEQMRLFAE